MRNGDQGENEEKERLGTEKEKERLGMEKEKRENS
jgi:hypothetical protein